MWLAIRRAAFPAVSARCPAAARGRVLGQRWLVLPSAIKVMRWPGHVSALTPVSAAAQTLGPSGQASR